MAKQQILNLRIDEDIYKILKYIARTENKSIAELIREMITKNIEEYRSDAEFKERLKKRVALDQEILNRLKEE